MVSFKYKANIFCNLFDLRWLIECVPKKFANKALKHKTWFRSPEKFVSFWFLRFSQDVQCRLPSNVAPKAAHSKPIHEYMFTRTTGSNHKSLTWQHSNMGK